MFTEISGDNKKRLRIAMSRLNSALLRHPNVDSAIDLRVALENIFLADMQELGEYTFRIRVRASRFLGKDFAERLKLDSVFNDLYKLGSTAVHDGELKKIKGREASSILDDGYRYISKAVEIIIRNKGNIEWKNIMLS